MPRTDALVSPAATALATVGRQVFSSLTYLGELGLLGVEAVRAVVPTRGSVASFRNALVGQLVWMLGMGLPIVGLIHIGMGSFLSMQAYFGATFLEGVGPVVGVGLVRNVAPMIAGLVLAGMLVTRLVWEFRTQPLTALDPDPDWVPDRDSTQPRPVDASTSASPGRLTLVRVLAAGLTVPILATWGTFVGLVIGGIIAKGVLDLPVPIYLGKFLEMLWLRDVVGLGVKGFAFGSVSAWIACHEGLRDPEGRTPLALAACRAMCLSVVAILFVNAFWFHMLYLAGPAFGPTVLVPPNT